MSESDGVYTILDALNEQNARAKGEPTEADKAHEKRTEALKKRMGQKSYAKKQHEAMQAERRRQERRAALGFDPTKVKVTVTRKAEPANIVTKTGEIVENTGRMTQAEFDGRKAKHDKLYEKDSSGKWVINCPAAKTYRHQVWEYMSKQRDDAGDLIRTEHPDARAVQLAGI